MKTGRDYKFWFCTGSQDLYGDECLRKVAEHSAKIVEGLNASGRLPFEVVLKPTLIDPATIRRTLNAANEVRSALVLSPGCIRFPRRKCGFWG